MNDIENALQTELRDPEYSEGYAESFLNSFIATQIKVIREQREMTQGELGECVGTTQAGISRYENVNYSSWNIKTLIRLARAFHVRLKVSFEPFGTLPFETTQFNRRSLERVTREEDPGLMDSQDREAHYLVTEEAVNMGFWKSMNSSKTANSKVEARINEDESESWWKNAVSGGR